MHQSGFFRFGRTEANQAASQTKPNQTLSHLYIAVLLIFSCAV